jgi:hypothetical protein
MQLKLLKCVITVSDYKKIRIHAHTKPFQGVLIRVQKVPRSNCIIVFPLDGMTEDILSLFFQSKRNGGGDISAISTDTTHDYAVIEFAEYGGMKFLFLMTVRRFV